MAKESDLENVELHNGPPGAVPGSNNVKKDGNSLSERVSFIKDKLEDLWILDITCIILSGLGLVGMSIFLHHFDGKPTPNWSHSIKVFRSQSPVQIAARITFNAILEQFSRFSTIFFAYVLTRSLGQLTWIWFTKHERQLTDFSLFYQAAGRYEIGALKLIWKLKMG